MSSSESSLYERVGGEAGIAGMVDSFYQRVLEDPLLKPFFENVPMDRLLAMQREFFGAATDGPMDYSGRPPAQVHQKMGIGKKEFQRFTEHLIATLEEKGIDEQDVLDVISRVNVYADEITSDTNVDG